LRQQWREDKQSPPDDYYPNRSLGSNQRFRAGNTTNSDYRSLLQALAPAKHWPLSLCSLAVGTSYGTAAFLDDLGSTILVPRVWQLKWPEVGTVGALQFCALRTCQREPYTPESAIYRSSSLGSEAITEIKENIRISETIHDIDSLKEGLLISPGSEEL